MMGLRWSRSLSRRSGHKRDLPLKFLFGLGLAGVALGRIRRVRHVAAQCAAHIGSMETPSS